MKKAVPVVFTTATVFKVSVSACNLNILFIQGNFFTEIYGPFSTNKDNSVW